MLEHPKYKGYAADELGNVYNKSVHNKRATNKDGWKLMKSVKHHNGYHSVNVWFDKKIRQKSVHHIVYECHHQCCPQYSCRTSDGLTIDHRDGDKSNNRIDNLRLMEHGKNSSIGNIGNTNTRGLKRSPEQIKLMSELAKRQYRKDGKYAKIHL